MSDTKEDVGMPIVEYSDEYDDESFAEESDDEAHKMASASKGQHRRKKSSEKNLDEDSNDSDEEKEVFEEREADDSGSDDGRVKKAKKKKVMSVNGVDLTPPEDLLIDARENSKHLSKEEKYRESVHELVRAMALARIVYGDGHWQLAQAYVDLSQGYLDSLGYVPQAVSHAETAKQIMTSSVHSARNETDKTKILEVQMNAHYILGRALAAQKKFSESEKCFLQSQSVHEKWAKSSLVTMHDTKMQVKIAIALAKVSLIQDKYASAANHYEKALDLVEVSHGKACKELIPIYQGLGKVELAKGKLGNSEVAISMYETAHTINSGLHPSGALPIAETGQELASAYATIGGSAAESSAESYLNECLTIYLSHLGPNHKSTIEVQDELVRLMLRTQRFDECIKELKSALRAKEEVYGELSQEVADAHKLLANIHQANGNLDAALKSYKTCINIDTMIHGNNHRRVKDTQANIDMIMSNPKIAAKQPKSKQKELEERPRFSSIVKPKKL